MKNHLFILEPKKKKSTLHPKCVFSSVMLCHEMKWGKKGKIHYDMVEALC